METYSHHIFYFPFKWALPDKENKLFSEQVDLKQIPIQQYTQWIRVQTSVHDKINLLSKKQQEEYKQLFNEQQYYFDFVHPVLYDTKENDNAIIAHYERREPQEGNVEYQIKHKEKEYILKIDAINLNLYSTGVGILSFFLSNKKENQRSPLDIRTINQYGRRIMPPHFDDKIYRVLIASHIAIKGLQGIDSNYFEDFAGYELKNTWTPAKFITSLISDLSSSLTVVPVIDDRMFVSCWYANNLLADTLKKAPEKKVEEFVMGDFWYKYVFVDEGNDDTCQNVRMKEELLKASTYYRWQNHGSLFGVSRYSLVMLTDESWFAENILAMHMRTIYSRMLELVLVQRASMLKFSGEVTKVSRLSGKNNQIIAKRIGSLYQEYIRFVNQIYFRSVTAQDQGIELYQMLMKQFDSSDQIKDLDDEIGELHQYVTLLIDQKRNENSEWLNTIAAIFLPATILTGIFGMNPFSNGFCSGDFMLQLIVIFTITSLISYFIIKKRRN